MDTQSVSVRFPANLHEALRHASYRSRISINKLVVDGAVLGLALSGDRDGLEGYLYGLEDAEIECLRAAVDLLDGAADFMLGVRHS